MDLPQPDSPTRPIASPGITVQEKSITAGISKSRVMNEIEKVLNLKNRAVVMSSLAIRSILQRFFAETVRKKVETKHQAQQREGGRQRWVQINESSLRPSLIVDPQSGLSGGRPRPKKPKVPKQDGGVADAQTEIDDQRAANVGQDFPQHDVPRRFTPGLRRRNIVAGFHVHRQTADDTEDGG